MLSPRRFDLLALSLAVVLGSGCSSVFDTELAESSGDAGGDSALPLPTCTNYCRVFADSCSTDRLNAVLDLDDCLSICRDVGGWEPGTFEDRSGNTIGCRIYHANAAAEGDREFHCGHAGAAGGNVCGSWCVNYCQMGENVCEGANALYPDFETCLEACDTIPDDGAIGDASGDTVQCRLYHILAAATPGVQSARTHCPHARLESADNVCD